MNESANIRIVSNRTRDLLERTTLWDSHACMPLRADDEVYLPQLARHKAAGVSVVSLNIVYDLYPPETAFLMLASFRQWIGKHPEDYVVVESVGDIYAAKACGKLAVIFDIEGGRAVEGHLGLVEVFYRLGVRSMLIAYNRNNLLGGGCQDQDSGLTNYGKEIIDEMERVGMTLCCSHTGYKTALQAIDYSRNPVIFSHSNPRALKDHERNIPDELMRACARSGGVVNLSGIGMFLGDNDSSTETLLRHIDYAVDLIGAEHVGLGLDYVFDQAQLNQNIKARPDIFPLEKGYCSGVAMIEPERFPVIAEGLLERGYTDTDVQGILGLNNLRVAERVWR